MDRAFLGWAAQQQVRDWMQRVSMTESSANWEDLVAPGLVHVPMSCCI